MVLSIGIGNLLMGLTAFVDRRIEVDRHGLPVSWLLLVLLQHLHLFWHTRLILAVNEWTFAEFL
jgi:hypothetical protein